MGEIAPQHERPAGAGEPLGQRQHLLDVLFGQDAGAGRHRRRPGARGARGPWAIAAFEWGSYRTWMALGLVGSRTKDPSRWRTVQMRMDGGRRVETDGLADLAHRGG